MTRLRRRYILATLSNGNLALLVNMAKRAGLPWDAVLGAVDDRHEAMELANAKQAGAGPRLLHATRPMRFQRPVLKLLAKLQG